MDLETATTHIYAKFEPCDPELFENLQGKFSLCYLRPSGDDVTICAHAMRLDEEGRLRSNPVFGDPPSVRASGVFALYQEAVARFLKNDIDLGEARALYAVRSGEFVQVPLDAFKAGYAVELRGKSDAIRQPYYDETMRRCVMNGEPFPPAPFGCEVHECEASGVKFWLDPLSGEPMFLEGCAPDLTETKAQKAARLGQWAKLDDLPF